MTKDRGRARQRPSWDEFFMFKALWAATRSSCVHLQTGAVIVKDKRVIATGYNGAPPGIENCLEKGCRKEKYSVDFNDKGKAVCRGIHAEINAMNQIARQDLKGDSLYSLYFPCSACAKAIAGNGLTEVIYSEIYQEPDSLTNEIFEEADVKLREFKLDVERYFDMIRRIREKRD